MIGLLKLKASCGTVCGRRTFLQFRNYPSILCTIQRLPISKVQFHFNSDVSNCKFINLRVHISCHLCLVSCWQEIDLWFFINKLIEKYEFPEQSCYNLKGTNRVVCKLCGYSIRCLWHDLQLYKVFMAVKENTCQRIRFNHIFQLLVIENEVLFFRKE